MSEEGSPRDAFCLCGSGKKATRCHDSDSPPLSADRLKVDKRLDETLWTLAMNLSETLKAAIEAMTVDPSDVKEGMYRICLSFHARKMYRATLAGLTLVRFGQSTQALTLKREQYYSWVSFHYYLENRDDAILFVASQPLRQRDKALERAELHPDLRADPEWPRELKSLEDLCNKAYREFRGLRRAKSKSANTSNPKMIDWPEPSTATMLRAFVKDWPGQLASMGQPVPEDAIEAWVEREARRFQGAQRQASTAQAALGRASKTYTIRLTVAIRGSSMTECKHEEIVLRPPVSVEGANFPVGFYACKMCSTIVGVSELSYLMTRFNQIISRIGTLEKTLTSSL
jgi:hypothetical protein